MPTLETLLIFTAAALLMNISPGPSNFYVVSRSVAQGWRGGAVAASGLAIGGLVHVVAAAFGVSALFHYFPAAYAVLKLAGAGYLVYLGIRYLMGGNGSAAGSPEAGRRPHRRILTESILVEVLNPKTALFFLAFLPQFVDVSRGPPAPQILLLGLIVMLSAVPCDLLVAVMSGSAARMLSRNARLARIQEYISGSILIALGLYVAQSERAG
jgi:threonine/homoserine/homoserine lactone efflux protein